jgi:hypothetical protein
MNLFICRWQLAVFVYKQNLKEDPNSRFAGSPFGPRLLGASLHRGVGNEKNENEQSEEEQNNNKNNDSEEDNEDASSSEADSPFGPRLQGASLHRGVGNENNKEESEEEEPDFNKKIAKKFTPTKSHESPLRNQRNEMSGKGVMKSVPQQKFKTAQSKNISMSHTKTNPVKQNPISSQRFGTNLKAKRK